MDDNRLVFLDPAEMEVRPWEDHRAARRGQMPLESQGQTHLRTLVNSLPADLKEQVQRAFRQWNLIVRDHMRNATGLRLTVGDDRQGVPVQIVDGLPAPFYDLIVNAPDPFSWYIAANQDLIAAGCSGVSFVSQNLPPRIWQSQPPNLATDEDLQQTARYLRWLVERANHEQPTEALRDINQDVLGAYFFREPRIELFWVPIGIVARLLQMPVEALTLVVLAHEVAHAYTHLGRDIDGTRWETWHFEKAELPIVEGLAQFYTRAISDRLTERYPAVHDAYDKLLKVQSEVYQAHTAWVPEAMPQAGEIVRSAMIISRSRGVTDYSAFWSLLQDARARIHR